MEIILSPVRKIQIQHMGCGLKDKTKDLTWK
jgi:hypothetical protein